MKTPMRLVWAAMILGGCVARLPAATIPPLPPGAWVLGSTNLEIVEPAPAPMFDYLNGKATSKESHYLAEILKHPESVVTTTVTLPNDKALGRMGGAKLPLVLYVLYPTTKQNPRAEYRFPYKETGDAVFPHMQRAGERPIFAVPGGEGTGGKAATKWPLIVFSSGYNAHGLWDLAHLKALAAHGYIVVSVFHGDGRMSFESGLIARPLEVSAAIDRLLADADFGPAIDAERIGVAGASFGGYTVLRVLGGSDPAKAAGATEPAGDARVKAGFGLVPLTGASMGMWPFKMEVWPFGRDYAGLRDVKKPFLAVYAGNDKTVRPETVEAGVRQISGPVSAVRLAGEQHLLTNAVWSDVWTWEVLFFDAWLKGDAEARRKLYGATSVEGGVEDERTWLRGGVVSPAR